MIARAAGARRRASQEDDAGRADRLGLRQPARPHPRAGAAGVGGDGGPAVLLCAHLDTVPLQAPVEPVLVDGRLGERQRGDPRRRQQGRRRGAAGARPPVLRGGLAGRARAAVHRRGGASRWPARARSTWAALRSDFGYVFDHASPIGEVDRCARPSHFRSRRASAAPPPTPGSAPRTGAARSSRPRVRSPRCRSGGWTRRPRSTSARSPAAGRSTWSRNAARSSAEVRSHRRAARAEELVAEIVDAVHDAANLPDCDCDVDVERRSAPSPATASRRRRRAVARRRGGAARAAGMSPGGSPAAAARTPTR